LRAWTPVDHKFPNSCRRRKWPIFPTSRRTLHCFAKLDGVDDTADARAEEEELSAAEREERLAQTLALIGTYNKLAPFDKSAYNPAIMLWQCLKKLPTEDKLKLLDRLDFRDIRKIWFISQKLAEAKQDQLAASMGPDYSIWDEFPEDPGEVKVFEGKASVPFAGGLRLDRFQKAFFLHPKTFSLMGRVLLGRGILGDILYPLYFTGDVERILIPSTGEVADVSLDYLEPENMPLTREDIPRSAWPTPGKHRFPFDGGLVDYMRPVGPGVFVGCGWKETLDAGMIGEQFLTFLMVAKD